MRVHPVGPSTIFAGFAWKLRRCGLPEDAHVSAPERSDSAAILGNGSPEHLVVASLAHELDGKRVLDLAKPQVYTHISAARIVHIHAERVNAIALMLDQNVESLRTIVRGVRKELEGTDVMVRKIRGRGRLRIYDCEHMERNFTLLVAISGLDDVPGLTKHTIEDHFLTAIDHLKMLGAETASEIRQAIDKAGGDPKEAWRRLSRRFRLDETDALHRLRERRKLGELFPQHRRALEHLAASVA